MVTTVGQATPLMVIPVLDIAVFTEELPMVRVVVAWLKLKEALAAKDPDPLNMTLVLEPAGFTEVYASEFHGVEPVPILRRPVSIS